MRGWEQNQRVYDELSHSRSNSLLGQQRLANDTNGVNVEAPAGSSYYWRNPQTGQVVGTDTNQPPDYNTSYVELKKL